MEKEEITLLARSETNEPFKVTFTKDEDKKVQWLAFIKKAKLTDAPGSFEDVAAAIKVFLEPVVVSIVDRHRFHGIWTAPGPWSRAGNPE